jgi:beta-fructofuranosidase
LPRGSERRGILDHGAYYAQKTQLDAHGNASFGAGFQKNAQTPNSSPQAGAGCMALPRILSLNPNGELEMSMAPEAQSLRGKA